MRISVLILLAMFTFQLLDVPPLPSRENPKTCCGRPVCLCTHEPGAACPIRKKADAMPAGHGHCDLRSPAAKTAPAKTVSEEETVPSGTFSKAPCATDSSGKMVPGHAREFYFSWQRLGIIRPRGEYLSSSLFNAPTLLHASRLDRPPKFFFSL